MKLFLTPLKSGLLAEVQMPPEPPAYVFLHPDDPPRKEYDKLKAIENAILLADECQEWAKKMIWGESKYTYDHIPFKDWQPNVGVIYEIEVDVEREVKTEPHYDGRPNGGNQRQVVLYKTKVDSPADSLKEGERAKYAELLAEKDAEITELKLAAAKRNEIAIQRLEAKDKEIEECQEMVKHQSVSFLSDMKEYIEGGSCGHIMREKWIFDSILNSQSRFSDQLTAKETELKELKGDMEDQKNIFNEAYELFCDCYYDDGSHDIALRDSFLSRFTITRNRL